MSSTLVNVTALAWAPLLTPPRRNSSGKARRPMCMTAPSTRCHADANAGRDTVKPRSCGDTPCSRARAGKACDDGALAEAEAWQGEQSYRNVAEKFSSSCASGSYRAPHTNRCVQIWDWRQHTKIPHRPRTDTGKPTQRRTSGCGDRIPKKGDERRRVLPTFQGHAVAGRHEHDELHLAAAIRGWCDGCCSPAVCLGAIRCRRPYRKPRWPRIVLFRAPLCMASPKPHPQHITTLGNDLTLLQLCTPGRPQTFQKIHDCSLANVAAT